MISTFRVFAKTLQKAPNSLRGVAKSERVAPVRTFAPTLRIFDPSWRFLRIQVAILTPPGMKFT
jgi:hypothetical protein